MKSVLDAGVAEGRAGAVQGVPRHGVDRRRPRPPRHRRSSEPGEVEAIGAEGIEVSVPARGSARAVHPRHAEAPVLGDQLRRRDEPRATPGAFPIEPDAVRHQTLNRVAPRIVLALKAAGDAIAAGVRKYRPMKLGIFAIPGAGVAIAALLLALSVAERGVSRLAAQQPAEAPRYQVDPFWPKVPKG